MLQENSEIYNQFVDTVSGITFLIPYHRQLSRDEAATVCGALIVREKEALFQAWKSRKENKDWSGDEAAKKLELFQRSNGGGEKLVLGDEVTQLIGEA